MYRKDEGMGFVRMPMPLALANAQTNLTPYYMAPQGDERSINALIHRLVEGLSGSNNRYKFEKIGYEQIVNLSVAQKDRGAPLDDEDARMLKSLLVLVLPYLARNGRTSLEINVVDYVVDPSIPMHDIAIMQAYSGGKVGPDMDDTSKLLNCPALEGFLQLYVHDFFAVMSRRVGHARKYIRQYADLLLWEIMNDHPTGRELDEFDRSFLLHAMSDKYRFHPVEGEENDNTTRPRPSFSDGIVAGQVMDIVREFVRGGNKRDFLSLVTNGDFESAVVFQGPTAQALPLLTTDSLKTGLFSRYQWEEGVSIPWTAEHELNAALIRKDIGRISPEELIRLIATPAYRTPAMEDQPANVARTRMVPMAPMAMYQKPIDLRDEFPMINDYPGTKLRWQGEANDGTLREYYYSKWRQRFVDGHDIGTEIMFDRVFGTMMHGADVVVENVTPAVVLAPPSSPLTIMTDAALARVRPFLPKDQVVSVYRASARGVEQVNVDVRDYYGEKGNTLAKPALAEFRSNTPGDLIEPCFDSDLLDFIVMELGMPRLDRIRSLPAISACVNSFLLKTVTGNGIEWPRGMEEKGFMTAIMSH
jgi:hypothetical protein